MKKVFQPREQIADLECEDVQSILDCVKAEWRDEFKEELMEDATSVEEELVHFAQALFNIKRMYLHAANNLHALRNK